SSSTISTDARHDGDDGLNGWLNGWPEQDFEAASVGAGTGEANLAADVSSKGLANGQAHPESFAPVSLIIVHLIKLVEEKRNVLGRDSDPRIADAHDDRGGGAGGIGGVGIAIACFDGAGQLQ